MEVEAGVRRTCLEAPEDKHSGIYLWGSSGYRAMVPWWGIEQGGHMKRIFLGVIGAISITAGSAALAADMHVKALKAPPPAVFSWTGVYFGGNAGVAINNSNYELDPTGCFLTGCGVGGVAANPFRTFANNLRQFAFTGGGQMGYNNQISPSLVAGLEADLNYDGIDQSANANTILAGPLVGGNTINSFSQRLDWFGTARARLGALPTDRFLVYATGGLAYGHISSSTGVLFPITCCGGDNYVGSASTARVGWTAGGGAEWAWVQNWSMKAEYLYVDLGTFNYADACVTPSAVCGAPFPTYQSTVTTREHIFRLGINYKLGGPLVAKY
jgi:outer membrane immunogenic protein